MAAEAERKNGNIDGQKPEKSLRPRPVKTVAGKQKSKAMSMGIKLRENVNRLTSGLIRIGNTRHLIWFASHFAR
jgi:hypothetical protein